jgi:hypothetical protein
MVGGASYGAVASIALTRARASIVPARRIVPARLGGARRLAAGQGIVEYGLILSGMTALAAAILLLFPETVAQILALIGAAIDSAR